MNKFFSFIAAALIALSANALEVTSSAGMLSSQISDTTITSLTVKGSMDARDFKFIADNLNHLNSIDLSGATIQAYSSTQAIFGNYHEYAAGIVPALCFFGKNYSSVTLPATATAIGEGALGANSAITSISFPATLDSIGVGAFDGCALLNSLLVPATVKVIGSHAFANCPALTTVTVSSPVIGEKAFANCTALNDLTLNETVEKIGAGAFSGDSLLTTLKFPTQLTSIGEEAFTHAGLATVDLSGCTKLSVIGAWAFANSPLKYITLPSEIKSVGNGAFYYDADLLQISLPDNLTKVSDYLLAGCSSIVSAKVGANTDSIGKYSMSGWTKLLSLYLPSSVAYLGDRALQNDSAFQAIKCDAETVPALGDSVFAGIDQPNTTLKVPENSVANYKAAEQWKEFRIASSPTKLIRTPDDEVKAFFSGTVLNIKSSIEIKDVKMYEPGGVMLESIQPATTTAQIETVNYSGHIYIVNVVLLNGTLKTFKLLR
jgi:hypothetical protein